MFQQIRKKGKEKKQGELTRLYYSWGSRPVMRTVRKSIFERTTTTGHMLRLVSMKFKHEYFRKSFLARAHLFQKFLKYYIQMVTHILAINPNANEYL